MSLDLRKKQILKAIVSDYIETAEPVGSKSLVNKFNLGVSSATVRNEMAELETMGYLEQPHTSAGRVPSDKGYREYVDSLMDVDQLDQAEIREIQDMIQENVDEISSLLKKASHILTETTGYTSVALTPRIGNTVFKQLKMMMIEPGRVLVVVVLSAGLVRDRVVRMPDVINEQQLQYIANAIESGLSGMRLDDITMVTVTAAGHGVQIPESLLNQILYEAYVSIKQSENLEMYIEGHNRLLSFPEFHDIRKAQKLFDTLSKDGMIAGYLNESDEAEEACPLPSGQSLALSDAAATSPDGKRPFMIRIGQEITLEGLQECSFVTTTYRLGERVIGRIGVMGPKRMEYGRVISHVGFVRSAISDYGKQFSRQENTNEVEVGDEG